jgi:hypothetical protein
MKQNQPTAGAGNEAAYGRRFAVVGWLRHEKGQFCLGQE